MDFTFYKTWWDTLWFFFRVIGNVRHPVRQAFSFDTKSENVKVIAVPAFWDNYSYIVTSGNDAMVIDPSQSKTVQREIEIRKLRLSSIAVTHEHIDHVAGVRMLQKKSGAFIYIPKGASIPGETIEITDGYALPLGGVSMKAIFVPGHYAYPYPIDNLNRNIAWYCEEAGILFTGDTLFSCGYGYTLRGHENAMFKSLKLLRSLPDDVSVFFGHEYSLRLTESAARVDSGNNALLERLKKVKNLLGRHEPTVPTTIRLEKLINPWLRLDDELFLKALGVTRGFVGLFSG